MSIESLITPAMRAAINSTISFGPCTIEAGAIMRFAIATGELGTAFSDEVCDAKIPPDGLTAPPTFLRSISPAIPSLPDGDTVPRVLDGGCAWEYHIPVRSGDVMTTFIRLESIQERVGRSGPLLLVEYVTEYINQRLELVVVQRNTIIRTR